MRVSDGDRSLEAQGARNTASDSKFVWGCQIAGLVAAAVMLVPTGVLLLLERLGQEIEFQTGLLLIGISGLLFALIAWMARKRHRERSLAKTVTIWSALWLAGMGLTALIAAISRYASEPIVAPTKRLAD